MAAILISSARLVALVLFLSAFAVAWALFLTLLTLCKLVLMLLRWVRRCITGNSP